MHSKLGRPDGMHETALIITIIINIMVKILSYNKNCFRFKLFLPLLTVIILGSNGFSIVIHNWYDEEKWCVESLWYKYLCYVNGSSKHCTIEVERRKTQLKTLLPSSTCQFLYVRFKTLLTLYTPLANKFA